MLNRLHSWWNQNILFDATQRLLLYEVLATQLSSGLTPQRAFETLYDLAPITPAISQAAASAAAAGREGRLLTDGLAESGCIPLTEIGILQIAERNNRLAHACNTLQRRAKDNLSLVANVFLPNSYYLLVFLGLVFMAHQAGDLLSTLGQQINVTNIPAYQMSLWLKSYILPIAIALMALALLVMVGRSSWSGAIRRLLWFFDSEYRALLAIRFADMAAMMSSEGATHGDILNVMETAFSHEPYIIWASSEAKQKHIGAGETIENALAGTFLTRSLSGLLGALTPGQEQGTYPVAYQALSRIQRARLQVQYRIMANGFRFALLIAIALILLTLIHGIYAVTLEF